MRLESVVVLVAALATTVLTACPLDPCGDLACGDHGSCDPATGACACESSYSGERCEVFDCATLACGDHGACNPDSARCDCEASWSGALCDTQETLEIIGAYVDDWAYNHDITQTTWVTMGSTFHIEQFSSAEDWLVARNDEANAYDPGLWSRFDWTTSNSELYICQTTYNAASEDAALAVTAANRADLTTGCNAYPWSRLTPR